MVPIEHFGNRYARCYAQIWGLKALAPEERAKQM